MEQKRNIIGNQSLSQGQPRVLKGATRTEDDIGFASKIDRQSRKLASASWSPSSFSMLSQGIDKNWSRHSHISHETSQLTTHPSSPHLFFFGSTFALAQSPPWDIVTISSPSASSALLKLLSTSYWPQVGIVACICINWYPIYQYYQFEIGRRSVCFPVKGDSHPPQ
jgi:hypothetical protein